MKVPKEIGSKYRMIVLAGKRVAQLQQGATPKIPVQEGEKNTGIAMQEIIDGKIDFRIPGKVLDDTES